LKRRSARRFREIEEAADLEAGSFLDSVVAMSDQWWHPRWGQNGAAELESWIRGGWEIEDTDLRAKLVTLWKRWRAEEAAETRATRAQRNAKPESRKGARP
jgi:hypothetical protein